ncbi:MAG: tRNA 2-thiouridine(34) synthase MnmA [Bacteroidales bacterium]|nr:tRNA 2-thiouridine(34) synthase MnmA [Bacteroidales bacterium]
MDEKKTRVVVGLSGGVDSSVAAYVLREQGYDVVGLFMRNWTDTTGVLKGDCPWMDDKFDAEAVARKLGIPFEFVDLSEDYHRRVVDYMFAEYAAGRTPNPDVLCNREIKFDSFLKAAQSLGADFVATGHYCRKSTTTNADGSVSYGLLAGTDDNKDQSYFLCQLNQEQLSKAMFPIGDMTKPEVREIATRLNLVTAHKKDSQGICFVGKVDLPVFLQQKLKAKEGKVFLIKPDAEIFSRDWSPAYAENPSTEALESLALPYPLHPKWGEKVGTHQGAQFYTIGQRKGLFIGGFPEPLFVIGTNIEHNQIFVGMGDNHPGLHRNVLKIMANEVHWLKPEKAMQIGESRRFSCRIRYRQPLQGGRAIMTESGLFFVFDVAQRGITPGQFAALYDGDEIMCSGPIAY